MVLLVVNEILTGEFLNSLVMNLFSFPIYVNFDLATRVSNTSG